MSSDIEVSDDLKQFFLNLYNGYSGIADLVDRSHRSFLHVHTGLEDYIEKWLISGIDVVLTGSPGDGKTHLLQHIYQRLDGQISLSVELDASQKTEDEILMAWQQARISNQAFFLAVNHAPLRKLAEKAKDYEGFEDLSHSVLSTDSTAAQSEIINFLIYSNEQQQEFNAVQQNSLMLIDLSYRASITDKNLVQGLIEKLCGIASFLTCSEEQLPPKCSYCPIKNNVLAMQTERVQNRLINLFELISQQGKRATVRDLLGFLVYTLTRGGTCSDLWKDGDKDCNDNDYYNLMFDPAARNTLFDHLHSTFDPGIFADTKVDIALWSGNISTTWIGETSAYVPNSLSELRSLKRRYFFEGSESADDQFCRMLSDT
ncbi:MAG: hypothetical protein KF893_16830, partial [Caldilineaceae bacterium]|nr:hypothetical protein [Caldilineaceae bacterium]